MIFYFQFERGEALDNITQDVKRVLEEECDEQSLKVLSKAVDAVRKKVWIPYIMLKYITTPFSCSYIFVFLTRGL